MYKILLIEDNDEIRENIEELLELSGYAVVSAPNGVKGVEKAMDENPDLILCDVMMPKLDGFGVLHILSKRAQTANIPFIFLTAKADKLDLRTGMNHGADDYLTKPFEHQELTETIARRIQKRQMQNQACGLSIESRQLTNTEKGKAAIQELAAQSRSINLNKKTLLYTEGQNPDYLYYMVKGHVKTFKTNAFEKEYITGFHKAGSFLGFKAILNEKHYNESAATLEDVEIRMLPITELFELMKHNQHVVAYLISLLAQDVDTKQEQLLNLAYNSISKRVALALLSLNDLFCANRKGCIDISREDLANMVGTATASISRMLSDFKANGLIDINAHGGIRINNREGLANLNS